VVGDSLVAIIDIGKTNAKLLIVDTAGRDIVWSAERPSRPVASSVVRQLDIHATLQWLLEQLAAVPRRERIETIVPVAHGAAAVLLDENAQVLCAPDYEDGAFESVETQYRAERDSFSATGSPFLPLGLNLGRQLYFLQERHPALWDRCQTILLYAQYWAWRLCGVMASEITTLGCHSDLWRLKEKQFSNLAIRMRWASKFPPLRSAALDLGPVRRDIAERTGLHPSCRVLCGLHDSNASFLSHSAGRPHNDTFAVIASGTWTVIMTAKLDDTALSRLNPLHDMLVNVDAFGRLIATARFMGGREYAAIAVPQALDQAPAEPTAAAIARLVARGAMALPAFAEAGGPFAGTPGRLVAAGDLTAEEGSSLASLYVALMTDLLLDLLGVTGDVVIDGPLARNSPYCGVLAALREPARIYRDEKRAGPVAAALYLAGYAAGAAECQETVTALTVPQLAAYKRVWRQNLPQTSLGDST
jgi:L-fuculokinase